MNKHSIQSSGASSLQNALSQHRIFSNRDGSPMQLRIFRETSSVADSTSMYWLGADYLVHLSPPTFPDVARQEQEAMSIAKSHIGPNLGKVILDVVASGTSEGRSYIVLPKVNSLSNNRFIKFIQKRFIQNEVLTWLFEFQKKTIVSEPLSKELYLLALSEIINLQELPIAIKKRAEAGIEKIINGELKTPICPTHGDLWLGNILKSKKSDLVIIDWRGSNMNGFPLFDLIRFSQSINLPKEKIRHEVIRHLNYLEISKLDADILYLASLGQIAKNLGEFPLSRYIQMLLNGNATLNSALGKPQV